MDRLLSRKGYRNKLRSTSRIFEELETRRLLASHTDELPTVQEVQFGDGTPQRSLIEQVVVTFNGLVDIDEGAFTVAKLFSNGSVEGDVVNSFTMSPVEGDTSASITFSGDLTRGSFDALVDGNYELIVDSSKVRRRGTALLLDGDGDGEAGGDFRKGGDPDDGFFAYFGDLNGDGAVGMQTDALAFRAAFGATHTSERYNRLLDFDGYVGGSARIVSLDTAKFRSRFGKSIERVAPPADVVAPGIARLVLDESKIDRTVTGDAIATANNLEIAFLMDGFVDIEGEVSGPVSLYDDMGDDGEIDGFSMENVVVTDLGSFSFNAGGVTVELTEVSITIPRLSYREGSLGADLPSFEFNAEGITLAMPGVNVDTEGLSVTFDPNSGDFSISANTFDLGFGEEIDDGNSLL